MAGMMSMIPEGLLLAFRARHSLVLENLALRHQIVVFQRSSKRPRLKMRDRVFWGPAVQNLEWLEGIALLRETGDGYPVASERLQAVLDLEESAEGSRATGSPLRSSATHT
jgi:hypothetical protein